MNIRKNFYWHLQECSFWRNPSRSFWGIHRKKSWRSLGRHSSRAPENTSWSKTYAGISVGISGGTLKEISIDIFESLKKLSLYFQKKILIEIIRNFVRKSRRNPCKNPCRNSWKNPGRSNQRISGRSSWRVLGKKIGWIVGEIPEETLGRNVEGTPAWLLKRSHGKITVRTPGFILDFCLDIPGNPSQTFSRMSFWDFSWKKIRPGFIPEIATFKMCFLLQIFS